ncbi:hypothetical protein F1559_001763 [Cyanidiococcus yangmingshanensis]|uniref:Uncharacterized protein n=1 Tax=Cyanidiococcus yangmingshanensis TaxID=2690220 RepID=A0A7J7IFQ2_9RHOD|nr:hypothetical protein F1559_001763 [Cyanidiococcus yangmingshanensis]
MHRLGFHLVPFALCGRQYPWLLTRRVSNAAVTRARVYRPRAGVANLSMSGWGDNTVVERVERRIQEALNPQSLRVEPTFGDPNGAHVNIRVVGECFQGKRLVARHQMVYRAIWKEMDAGVVHAVDSLETLTPEEANK